MSNFAERLHSVIFTLKIGKGVFAATGGVRGATFKDYLDGKTLPNQETLAKWVRAYGIDAHWLLTGEGEMLRTGPAPLSGPMAKQVNKVERIMLEAGADELDILRAARAMLDGEINKITRERGGYGVAEPGAGLGRAAEEHAPYAAPDQDEGSDQG